MKYVMKYLYNNKRQFISHILLTFVPSVRLVKQTMLQTSSCQIMVQKSAIVFGFGPSKKNNIFVTVNENIVNVLIIEVHCTIGYPG